MSTYAERLKEALSLAREKDGSMNQSELARRIGVKPQTIQYLCRSGPKNKKSKHTVKIARELGVNPDWLEEGIGDRDTITPIPFPTNTTAQNMVKEPNSIYTLDSIAKKGAMQFADKYAIKFQEITGEPFPPEGKLEVFELMIPRFLRRLKSGLNLPGEEEENAEIIELIDFQQKVGRI